MMRLVPLLMSLLSLSLAVRLTQTQKHRGDLGPPTRCLWDMVFVTWPCVVAVATRVYSRTEAFISVVFF